MKTPDNNITEYFYPPHYLKYPDASKKITEVSFMDKPRSLLHPFPDLNFQGVKDELYHSGFHYTYSFQC